MTEALTYAVALLDNDGPFGLSTDAGEWWVDWDRAHRAMTGDNPPPSSVLTRLLIAARGRIPEITREELDVKSRVNMSEIAT